MSGVEGEEAFRTEMQGGGDVEDVESAMAAIGSCLTGENAGVAQHRIHVEGDQMIDAGGDVALPVTYHAIRFQAFAALGIVARLQPDLELRWLARTRIRAGW